MYHVTRISLLLVLLLFIVYQDGMIVAVKVSDACHNQVTKCISSDYAVPENSNRDPTSIELPGVLDSYCRSEQTKKDLIMHKKCVINEAWKSQECKTESVQVTNLAFDWNRYSKALDYFCENKNDMVSYIKCLNEGLKIELYSSCVKDIRRDLESFKEEPEIFACRLIKRQLEECSQTGYIQCTDDVIAIGVRGGLMSLPHCGYEGAVSTGVKNSPNAIMIILLFSLIKYFSNFFVL